MQIIEIANGQKITEPGIYRMSNAWYHANCCEGPSFSASIAIDLHQECPRAVWFDSYLNPKRPIKANKRFDLGTAAHAAVLEKEWQKHVVIIDDNASAPRKKHLKATAKKAGAVSLAAEQMARIMAARDALWSDDECRELTTKGQNELSYFAQDDDTGLWLKVRPDVRIRIEDLVRVRDYKTTDGSVHPRAIASRMYDGGWIIQAAAQLDVMTRVEGAAPHDFKWIVQEMKEPYLSNIVAPSIIALDWGMIIWKAMIREFFSCLTADDWPAYERNVELELPRGIEMQLEERKDRGDFGSPERVGEDYARRAFGAGNDHRNLEAG